MVAPILYMLQWTDFQFNWNQSQIKQKDSNPLWSKRTTVDAQKRNISKNLNIMTLKDLYYTIHFIFWSFACKCNFKWLQIFAVITAFLGTLGRKCNWFFIEIYNGFSISKRSYIFFVNLIKSFNYYDYWRPRLGNHLIVQISWGYWFS